MRQRNATRTLSASALAAIVTFVIGPLRAEVLEKTAKVDGTTVQYKVVLPDVPQPAGQ